MQSVSLTPKVSLVGAYPCKEKKKGYFPSSFKGSSPSSLVEEKKYPCKEKKYPLKKNPERYEFSLVEATKRYEVFLVG